MKLRARLRRISRSTGLAIVADRTIEASWNSIVCNRSETPSGCAIRRSTDSGLANAAPDATAMISQAAVPRSNEWEQRMASGVLGRVGADIPRLPPRYGGTGHGTPDAPRTSGYRTSGSGPALAPGASPVKRVREEIAAPRPRTVPQDSEGPAGLCA